MARQVQIRRGTTAEHSTFTGAVGELTVDTTKDVVVVHDGSTAGGVPMLKAADLAAGTGIDVTGTTITNTAPDQTVSLTGGTGISTSGTYPDFTITNDSPDQTVVLTDGTGITTSGTYPNFTITNSAPDQTVVLTEGSNVTITGTYPNFTIASTDTNTTYTAGSGLSLTGTEFANTAPDQTVVLTEGSNVTITGTYPNFTIAATDTNTTYTAGTGLVLAGTEFSVGTTVVTSTYTGDVDITGELIVDSYNETYAAVTSTSNATTVDCEAGNAFSHTLTENTTFTFSNPPASGTAYSFSLEIIQDASAAGFTVTWPTSVDWPSATAPTLTATASAKDVFVFYTRDGGTNWAGFVAGQALG